MAKPFFTVSFECQNCGKLFTREFEKNTLVDFVCNKKNKVYYKKRINIISSAALLFPTGYIYCPNCDIDWVKIINRTPSYD